MNSTSLNQSPYQDPQKILLTHRTGNRPEDYVTLSEFIVGIPDASIVAVDTETSGEDIRDGRGYLQGISIAYVLPGSGRVSHYFPFRHRFGFNYDKGVLSRLKDVLEFRNRGGHYLCFHNSKFDLESLRSAGIYLDEPVGIYCTMLMAHLVNEVLPYAKDLSSCSKRYIDDPGKKEDAMFVSLRDTIGWANIPSEVMYEYAAYDADLCLRLYIALSYYMSKEKLWDYWEYKAKTVNISRKMERRGVIIDVPLCERMTSIGQMQMDDLSDLLGGMNPASSKDLKKLLIDELKLPVVKRSPKTNAPSFDKEAMLIYEQILERQDTNNELAQMILTYRGWSKSVSSNYIPYVTLLSPDGRLRPNYKLHGTKTGRFSCEKPNLQQIPRVSDKPWNGKMKACFLAEPGWTLWEGDYSQLELRLATGLYAPDPALLEVFNTGGDIFTEMAAQTGFSRHDQKTLTYTIQYGGGIKRISHVFGVDMDRARQIREHYFNSFPAFRKASLQAEMAAITNKKVKLWSGRYRHFQFPRSERHKAFNAAIQGGAADIVERSMHRLERDIDGPDVKMLLQIHDSVVFAIRDESASQAVPEIQRIMEDVTPDFNVKFNVDVHRLVA